MAKEMSFVGAKSILKAYSNYKSYHDGTSMKDMAFQEGVSEDAIRKRIKRIENYISSGTLDMMLDDAKNQIKWVVMPTIATAHEVVPVRSSSGCRFTPL